MLARTASVLRASLITPLRRATIARRRAGGRHHAEEARHHVIRYARLDHGRQIGIVLLPGGAGDGERPQLLVVDQGAHRRDVVDGELALAAQHAGQRFRSALEMHGDEVQAGLELVEFAREVGEVGRAGGAIVELAGIGLAVGGELGHRLDRQVRIDHQDLIGIHHLGDGGEILRRVVAGGFRHRRDVGERRRIAEQQRVAIGVGTRHRLRGDRAAGAAAVVDDHALAERGRHAVTDQPCQDVGRTAGSGRHDELDDLVRIGLGIGGIVPAQGRSADRKKREQ